MSEFNNTGALEKAIGEVLLKVDPPNKTSNGPLLQVPVVVTPTLSTRYCVCTCAPSDITMYISCINCKM